MLYRIYTEVNCADTFRDADDIRQTELGVSDDIEKAKKFAIDYIKKNFFHKDTKLVETKDGGFVATDFCSYGQTIRIKKMKVI